VIRLRQSGVKEDRSLHENKAHSLYNAKSSTNAGIQITWIQYFFNYIFFIHIAVEAYQNFLCSGVGLEDRFNYNLCYQP